MAWKNVQYENGKYRTSEGGGGGSSTFAGLEDVNLSNLQNGQVPKYNSTTHKWENANESGGGGTVTDVTVDGTSVVNQQGVAEIPAIPDGLHHYSTTEKVIGTWVDGKPLYEKIVQGTTITGGQNDYVNHNIQNLDTLVDSCVMTHFSDNGYWRKLNFAYNNGGTGNDWLGGYAVNSTQIIFQIGVSYASYLDKWYATLQYTKTTDV